jgi:hypothetical protein
MGNLLEHISVDRLMGRVEDTHRQEILLPRTEGYRDVEVERSLAALIAAHIAPIEPYLTQIVYPSAKVELPPSTRTHRSNWLKA